MRLALSTNASISLCAVTYATLHWENDAAADWFGGLFEKTQLASHVQQALDRDPKSDPDVIRAACHLLIQLGHTYIWPVQHLDRDLALAIRKLEAMRNMEEFQEIDGLADQIDQEILALRSRQRPPG